MAMAYPRSTRDLIADIVETGYWPNLDLLFLAGETEPEGNVNLKTPGRFNFAKTGSVNFLANRYWQGDGTSGSLTASGWNPRAGTGIAYSQDSALVGVYIRQPSTFGAAARIDVYTNPGQFRRSTSLQTALAFRHNDATTAAYGPPALTGHFQLRRNGAAARQLWLDGVEVNSDAAVSVNNAALFALFGVAGQFSDSQISFAYAGSAPNNATMQALNAAFAAWRAAVGA